MYVRGRSAVQVTKELANSLRHFSLNTGALQGSVRPGKVSSLQNTVMVQTDFCFCSWSEHIILHNPNEAFVQCFTTVILKKSLNLLSWQAKENMGSICIIHSRFKHSLFFSKMFGYVALPHQTPPRTDARQVSPHAAHAQRQNHPKDFMSDHGKQDSG